MNDLIRRAIAAWYRSGNTEQPGDTSAVETIEGLEYVVLRNVKGPLAVYRLTNQGRLRSLRRWPAEIKAEA